MTWLAPDGNDGAVCAMTYMLLVCGSTTIKRRKEAGEEGFPYRHYMPAAAAGLRTGRNLVACSWHGSGRMLGGRAGMSMALLRASAAGGGRPPGGGGGDDM